MGVRLDHHVAVRTRDIDASIRFWTEALDGRLANQPVVRGGGYLEQLFAPGVQVKIVYILFDAGAIELFEFVEPREDVPPSRQTVDGLMHFGVIVDDVPKWLERVEKAGATRRIDVNHMGGRADAPRFVYCESPEGHVFELMEADAQQTVQEILKTIALLEAEEAAGAA